MNLARLIYGVDVIQGLKRLADKSVQCVMTSPPYWGLRDYDAQGQIGLEQTFDEWLSKMVGVFGEVRRVLRDDGTIWVNMGDCYSATRWADTAGASTWKNKRVSGANKPIDREGCGLPPKNLVGQPWRLAFALQEAGWVLRSDIIWSKPNPMPESVTDRPTKSHEYLFLLSKNQDYFYDAESIREKSSSPPIVPWEDRKSSGEMMRHGGSYNAPALNGRRDKQSGHGRRYAGFNERWDTRKKFEKHMGGGGNGFQGHSGNKKADGTEYFMRNKRTVWEIATAPYPEAHFATFPMELVKPCILAGTSAKGCCAKCGAPYERKVEKSRTFESGSGRSGNMPNGKNGPALQGGGETKDIRRGPVVQTETTGWTPQCKHKVGIVPCKVLDPFSGSGTTGACATGLGRRYIGIDLNKKYLPLAIDRIGEMFVTIEKENAHD